MRVALLSRLACVLVVLIAACDHKERVDQNPAADAWTELSNRMNGQIASLRERQKAVTARITALAVPPGTEDVTLAATVAELQGTVGPLDQAIGTVEAAANQATADVRASLAGRDKRAAERAVTAARASFEAAAAGADPALALIEPKLDMAEQIVQRLSAGVESELSQLRGLATAGGSLDFSAIEFKADSADFDFTRPASKATLDRLVQFAAACPQLRFGITGNTAKEGAPARNKELSLQRAEAVKTYLLAVGVEPEKIVRTAGLGSTKTLVDEPDPGSPAAAAMDAGTLESLRRKNRRITVEVVTSCSAPAPTAAAPQPPAQLPPAPPTAAVRPLAERPPVQQPH